MCRERRASDVERSLGCQDHRAEGLDRSGGVAVSGEYTERLQRVQRRLEGRLADRIVGRGDALAAGNFAHSGRDILVAVQNRMVTAIGPRELRLLFRADAADDVGAEQVGPLAQDQADATGSGIDQNIVAGLYRISPKQQVMRGESLEHHRRGGFVGDTVRQPDQFLGIDHARLGIGAEQHRIGHPVADREAIDPVAERIDHADPFHADHGG